MPQPIMAVEISGLKLKNPVLPASGTYGYGKEYLPFFTPDRLGAVVTKGVSLTPWPGNQTPRIHETPGGMLNAIGLQNPGVGQFIKEAIPFLRRYQTPVIVNIVGKTIEEYAQVAEILNEQPEVSGFELNISCPNVKEGGIAFGVDPLMAALVTSEVRKKTNKPLIVKLSPNVTDIVTIARHVEDAGADGLSLINTLLGMAIDIRKRKPILANLVGGLSGPAIKPVALRMVWQTFQKVKIPIIGIGGICTASDAIEFIMAGATAVGIGTGIFREPLAPVKIIEGIREFLVEEGFASIAELKGVAHC
ncbi:MAG: dihydroorotate dehydrogenase [Firmicutes bacterium]|mgnify:CR=1 FL=1|nr:dihydroorotate dehydrogenase [Bacillota bacterium]